jgi:hypothetical protein
LLPVLPFDLHVLGLPLALILSQDQTLHSKVDSYNSVRICYSRILSIKIDGIQGLLFPIQFFKERLLIILTTLASHAKYSF